MLKINLFSSFFLFTLQTTLKEIVVQREDYFEQLNRDINSLDELNHVVNVAEHIIDMNNQIDDHYLPVEILYKTLSLYDPILLWTHCFFLS